MNLKEVKEKLERNSLGDREIVSKEKFRKTTTFSAVHRAEEKASKLGYSIGSMCRDEPIGLSKKASYIAKWRNIDRDEYDKIEGVILSNDFREDDVYLIEFKEVV